MSAYTLSLLQQKQKMASDGANDMSLGHCKNIEKQTKKSHYMKVTGSTYLLPFLGHILVTTVAEQSLPRPNYGPSRGYKITKELNLKLIGAHYHLLISTKHLKTSVLVSKDLIDDFF